jgi:hypothetical protein
MEMGSLVETKMAGGKGGKGGNLPSKNPPTGFVNDIRRLTRRGLAPVRWKQAGRKPAETGRKPAETPDAMDTDAFRAGGMGVAAMQYE